MKVIRILFFLLGILLNSTAFSQAPKNYKNPILPGFHPDPSICRVGDDYYLANSSFEWFPGVPIYHSKDLVNWELIGYALTRKEQLPNLINTETSRGIYAPTLRYHDGLFYMITTCVQCDGNFYVTAKDPAGEWSDPVWLKNAPGIDPSLFWDDDGRCWYTGAGRVSQLLPQWPNQNGIWMQELDTKQGKLIGEKIQLTHGHSVNSHYTEGPHLYKINGRYMLLVAEGGTGFTHAVTVFDSKDIKGPYVPSQINPVITHRNLGKDYPISTIGHADLVQTQKGDWYSVMLGKRELNGIQLLARETFLTSVKFENGWPVFNPGVGKVLEEDKFPNLPISPISALPAKDDFNKPKLRLEYNFLRTPEGNWYQINKGDLEISLKPEKATQEKINPAMIVRRIESPSFETSTSLSFNPANKNDEAGITAFRNAECHYTFTRKGDNLVLTKVEKGVSTQIESITFKEKDFVLKMTCTDLKFTFSYGKTEKDLKTFGTQQLAKVLSDNISGGFNGPYVGMYASSNGEQTKAKAYYHWFEYKEN